MPDVAPPPAILATAKPCGEANPRDLFWQTTTVVRSPDCRWMIVVRGDAKSPIRLDRRLAKNTLVVADKTGHVVAQFAFERSADAYWLDDGRTLVINYYEGSIIIRPLVIVLDRRTRGAIDLRKVVAADLTRRAGVRFSDLDHYYAVYEPGKGARLRIGTEFRYNDGPMTNGSQPQAQKCYRYSIDRVTFRKVRFEGEGCGAHEK